MKKEKHPYFKVLTSIIRNPVYIVGYLALSLVALVGY